MCFLATCVIAVSSVTIVNRRGGGGDEVMYAPASLTTVSEVGSETMSQERNSFTIHTVKFIYLKRNCILRCYRASNVLYTASFLYCLILMINIKYTALPFLPL